VAKGARHVVGRLHHTTADLFHRGDREGQAQVTAHTLIQKQSKPKKAVEGKEKDEEVLRNF
jgi:hypothetical protein